MKDLKQYVARKRFTDTLLDVAPLMDKGCSTYGISIILRIDIELVEQCVAHIDELRFHEYMMEVA